MNIRENIIIRPKCKCHGIEMVPRADSGTWRCRIKARAANKKYRSTGKAKIHDRKYRESEQGRKKIREYRNRADVFMKQYFCDRSRKLKTSREYNIAQLEIIHKQLKELGLEPRQK
jgi:hypothetical protein